MKKTKINKIFELLRLDPTKVPEKTEFWALYATTFYEKLFSKINDEDLLDKTYEKFYKNPKLDKRAREALTFFYNLRQDELEDPDYWDKVGMKGMYENKKETMKAKLVKESLNEYYDSEDDALSRAKQEAREISREEGVVQHVNEIRPGVYKVEDWYDYEQTVATYNNGILESLSEEVSPAVIDDFQKLAKALERRRVPCNIQLTEFGGKYEIDVLCGFDYPDEVADEVFDAMDEVDVDAEVSAEQHGGTIIKSKRIAGGPRQYRRW